MSDTCSCFSFLSRRNVGDTSTACRAPASRWLQCNAGAFSPTLLLHGMLTRRTDSYRHWDLDRSCIGVESFQYRYIVANDVAIPS